MTMGYRHQDWNYDFRITSVVQMLSIPLGFFQIRCASAQRQNHEHCHVPTTFLAWRKRDGSGEGSFKYSSTLLCSAESQIYTKFGWSWVLQIIQWVNEGVKFHIALGKSDFMSQKFTEQLFSLCACTFVFTVNCNLQHPVCFKWKTGVPEVPPTPPQKPQNKTKKRDPREHQPQNQKQHLLSSSI